MIVPRALPDVAEIAAHYDDLDRFYREIWGEHVHHGLWDSGRESPEDAVRRLIDAVADRALVKRGDAVCDVGCGYGGTSRTLARERGARVTGLTVSKAQYDYALGLDPEADNPAYLLRDWLANGLEPASFDAVISIESSEHMADKYAFFEEAYRVLKPGGRLVVCAWLAKSPPHTLGARHLLEPICREGRLPGMGSADEYHEWARAAGLIPVDFQDVSHHVKRTWTLCILRGLRNLLTRSDYRRFVLGRNNANRVFALTLFRIRVAYELGVMGYGIFTARRPEENGKAQ